MPRLLHTPVVLVLAALLAAPLHAQPIPPASPPASQPDESRDGLEARFVAAFAAGKLDAAAEVLVRAISLFPSDASPHYNLACVRARQGDTNAGEQELQRAVDLGFTSFDLLQSDPDLAPLRHTETYKRIVANIPALQDSAIDKRLDRLRKGFGDKYRCDKDPVLRLAFASGFEEGSFKTAREEVERLAAWWKDAVLPEAEPGPARAHPWVTVIWPARDDWNAWARKNFGDRFGSVGGIYDDNKKELVAQDLGPTMRHEFMHVMHWRDMHARRQLHPIWVQEGLCSLVEDVDPDPSRAGGLKLLPSWRTNSLKRLQSGGNLPTLKQIIEMPPAKFSGSRPLANYAAARSIFLFLADKGKLREWYGAYVAGYADDQTGSKALEKVFAKPLADVEKQWKAWLRTLPEVAEVNRPGKAELPFGIDYRGSGDGLPVAMVTRMARDAGIKVGDVLMGIDGKPVRDAADLARVLGEHRVGEEVEVSLRRGKTEMKLKVTLMGRE